MSYQRCFKTWQWCNGSNWWWLVVSYSCSWELKSHLMFWHV